MKRTTEQIETVETYNLYLSLKRLHHNYDEQRVKRALYHAVCMSESITGFDERKALREALKLP